MILEIIKPETELEKILLIDSELIEGMMYGKPRKGHPEGSVIYHVGEVLANIDKYSTPENREKLRLVAIIHDSFKYKVDRTRPRVGENHHSMLARRFAEKYITDVDILDLIELHDEAFLAWRGGNESGDFENAENRVIKLFNRLTKPDTFEIPLVFDYLTFYRCDNETGDKGIENYTWFEEHVHELNWVNKKTE
jgi:hypothetical protein